MILIFVQVWCLGLFFHRVIELGSTTKMTVREEGKDDLTRFKTQRAWGKVTIDDVLVSNK